VATVKVTDLKLSQEPAVVGHVDDPRDRDREALAEAGMVQGDVR